MNKVVMILVMAGLASACAPAKRGHPGTSVKGTDATNCVVTQTASGASIQCPDSVAVVTNGSDGVNGSQGAQGQEGAPGLQGNQGLAGAPGQNGERGASGDKGDVGDKGDRGTDGNNGNAGLDGKDGEKGNSGEKGDKGDTGATPEMTFLCHIPNGAAGKRHSMYVPEAAIETHEAHGDYPGECL